MQLYTTTSYQPDVNRDSVSATDSRHAIRVLNDRFRRSGVGGFFVTTQGIRDCGDDVTSRIVSAIMNFDDFTEDNDPHGTHGSGAFDHVIDGKTRRIFWQIDCYAPDGQSRSPDPADLSVTTRILTVFFSMEY